jgi:hypothetical protein
MVVAYAALCVMTYALLRCVNPGNLGNPWNLDLGTDLARVPANCGSKVAEFQQ